MLIFALYVFIFLIRVAFDISDGFEENYWIFGYFSYLLGDLWFISDCIARIVFLILFQRLICVRFWIFWLIYELMAYFFLFRICWVISELIVDMRPVMDLLGDL